MGERLAGVPLGRLRRIVGGLLEAVPQKLTFVGTQVPTELRFAHAQQPPVIFVWYILTAFKGCNLTKLIFRQQRNSFSSDFSQCGFSLGGNAERRFHPSLSWNRFVTWRCPQDSPNVVFVPLRRGIRLLPESSSLAVVSWGPYPYEMNTDSKTLRYLDSYPYICVA